MMKKIILTFVLLLGLMSNKIFASNQNDLKTDSTNSSYSVIKKSSNIESVEIKKKKKADNIIFLTIGKKDTDIKNDYAVASGISGKTQGREKKEAVGPIFDKIDVLRGSYGDISVVKQTNTQNFYTLKDVIFPLHLRMHAGKELVEFEIKENGRWTIDVNYKNN